MPRSIPHHTSFIKGSSAAREGLDDMRRKKADYSPPTSAEVLDWFPRVEKSRKGRRALKSALRRVEKRK